MTNSRLDRINKLRQKNFKKLEDSKSFVFQNRVKSSFMLAAKKQYDRDGACKDIEVVSEDEADQS